MDDRKWELAAWWVCGICRTLRSVVGWYQLLVVRGYDVVDRVVVLCYVMLCYVMLFRFIYRSHMLYIMHSLAVLTPLSCP